VKCKAIQRTRYGVIDFFIDQKKKIDPRVTQCASHPRIVWFALLRCAEVERELISIRNEQGQDLEFV